MSSAHHPGKTPAQRRALDAIGCGDNCPPMARKTRESLLSAGLIVEIGQKALGRDRFGVIAIPQFEMPIPVHMQWCNAVADEEDEP